MGTRTSRRSARVILVDQDGRVLLVRVSDPLSDRPPVWLTPGGGVDGEEDLATAAARELAEETGLLVTVADLGAPVAVCRGDWEFRGQPLHSEDWFFFQDTETFDPDESGWTDLERELHSGWRWWSAAELESPEETVIPAGLATLIERLLSEPRPPSPIELEWVDA